MKKRRITVLLIALGGIARIGLAEPIDTRAFAFLKPLMTEQEVVRRVGAPDRIADELITLVPVWINGRKELRQKRRYVLIYNGDGHIMTSYLRMEDGRIVETWKNR